MENAAVSEPQPDSVNAHSETGSVDSGPVASGSVDAGPATASSPPPEQVESPKLVPGDAEAEEPKASRPTGEMIIMAPYRGDQRRAETASDESVKGPAGLF